MCVEFLLGYYCRDRRHCEGVSALKSIYTVSVVYRLLCIAEMYRSRTC